MKTETISEVVTEYAVMGCRPGCAHDLGTRETRELRTNPLDWTKYTNVEIHHSCALIGECAKRRAEIYKRAQSASDAVPSTFGGNVSRMAKKRRQEWRAIADEYTNSPCPFFVAAEK